MRDKKQLTDLFALGIAGNSAGHLQQTGESKAFREIKDINKPQALFPFYIPSANEDYLAVFPYSIDSLQLPNYPQAKVQMEPELALKLKASYNKQGQLIKLQPIAMTLINDATYRNKQVTKLAQKKNWGIASKGIAQGEIKITDFSAGSALDKFRLCGFHQRHGQWQLCGSDIAVTEYSYFYQQLLQWLVTQIQQQRDQGMLHDIQQLLVEASYPEAILVAIGASRYNSYGEQHQLVAGDQTAIVLYNNEQYDVKAVSRLIEQDTTDILCNEHLLILQQKVI